MAVITVYCDARPALIKTDCKHYVESYHGYHTICPSTSFSWDVLALPRERHTFLSKNFYVYCSYVIELLFLKLRRCIDLFLLLVSLPPHGSNQSLPCLFCVHVSDIHRTRNYGFTRSTQPITVHERAAIYKSQLEAIIKKPGNTRGVGTSFWSLIRRRTIPGFRFICNAGYCGLKHKKRKHQGKWNDMIAGKDV